MPEEIVYELLFPFLDESPSFSMGFECGKLYGQMLAQLEIEATIHVQSWEQIRLMADSAQYSVIKCHAIDEIWLSIKLLPQQ